MADLKNAVKVALEATQNLNERECATRDATKTALEGLQDHEDRISTLETGQTSPAQGGKQAESQPKVTNFGHVPGRIVKFVQEVTHEITLPNDKVVKHDLGAAEPESKEDHRRPRLVEPAPLPFPRNGEHVPKTEQPTRKSGDGYMWLIAWSIAFLAIVLGIVLIARFL